MALKRTLTFGMLVFLTINALIGTGIFFAPGIAASIAGVNSIISWVLAIIVSILIAVVFAELASIYPKAGGVYEYSKRAFGKSIGFTVGWMSWVVSNIVISMLVVGSLDYLSIMFPISNTVKILAAVGFVLAVNYISFRGIEISGKLLIAFSLITIAVLALIAFSGSTAINLDYLRGIRIDNIREMIPVIIAMFYAIETFFGWESISYLSEETKNPRKNIPKALLIGTLIISAFVMFVIFVSLASVPAEELGSSSYPLLLVASKFFPPAVVKFISLLAVLTIMGGAASWIITTPRLIYAMSRDKVLPYSFSRVHPKYKTPYIAIFLQTAITLLVIVSGSYKFLLEVALPLAIVMYAIVILSVPKLRKTHPRLKREFKLPFPRLISFGLVALLLGVMAISTTAESVILGFVFILLGMNFYLIATLGYHEKIIKIFSNLFAEISFWFDKLFIDKDISHHILNYLSDVTIEKVLDLGCGVGVITNRIAKEVIPPSGIVYGVDFSERALKIARVISKKRDIKNVEYIHENFYNLSKNKKVNRKLRKLDAVVGVGVLGYIDRLDFILNEIKKRLRKHGKIYFVDYDYPGHFLDKPLIEDNTEIHKLFERHGFKIRVWRQKKPLWTYVHIYGEKK
ncbi:MAG: amino acid permease [Nanoarchaeota archaeon]|nr:amino acid permease [Nanoarchaeota archaeon]